MTERELNRLLEKYAPAIRDAILAGIRELRDSTRLGEIISMIEQNNVDGALRALGYNPALFNSYYMLMMQAFEQGGLTLMAGLPTYTRDAMGVMTKMRFNVRDREAERWLSERSSALVTNIEEDVRYAVRTTLANGLERGQNPRTVALDLVGRYNQATGHREGGVVGLGEREIAWARSIEQKLRSLDPSYFEQSLRDKRFDEIVRKAIAENKPLPAETVQKLTDRYRDIALKYRGDTIGRTEALAALNRSEYESTRQALAQSDLPLSAATKVWDSAGDLRVRNSHQAMDEQRVGIDEPFISPITGAKMMHPHDTSLGAPGREIIACRCRVRYEIDFLAGIT